MSGGYVMKITSERISAATYAYWHYTFDYTIESIAACGFRNMEFWAASPQYSYLDFTPQEKAAKKKEINRMLSDRGLKMTAFHPEQQNMYPLNIASPNSYLRDNSIRYMKEYIDDAADFETDTIVLAPGWHVEDDQDPANYDRSVEALRLLSEYAAQYRITTVVEEWPAIQRAFADTLPRLKQLLDDVAMNNCKACINSDLMHGGSETVADYLAAFGPERIGLVHLADEGSRAIGSGNTAAADLAALEASAYAGTISVDIRFRDVCINPDKPYFSSAGWLKSNGYLV